MDILVQKVFRRTASKWNSLYGNWRGSWQKIWTRSLDVLELNRYKSSGHKMLAPVSKSRKEWFQQMYNSANSSPDSYYRKCAACSQRRPTDQYSIFCVHRLQKRCGEVPEFILSSL
jgi:hypothetical protein